MAGSFTLLLPFDAPQHPRTRALASALAQAGHAVVLAGPGAQPEPGHPSLQAVDTPEGRGCALRHGLSVVKTPYTVLQDASWPAESALYDTLLAPLEAGDADVVIGSRAQQLRELRHLSDRALGWVANLATEQSLEDPLSGLKAFRTEALQSLNLRADDDGIDAELMVKLAAQLYRVVEVPLALPTFPNGLPLREKLARARTLFRYATVQNASDNLHEGYNTLIRMEGAKNYNAWLGQKFRPHLGQRVLEIGAGLGTITRQIETGRELVIALEVDAWYVDRLKNAFRHKPHIRPYLSDVALADWQALQKEQLDSIVLSNVLEHIPDDAGAVRRFREILPSGGALVLLVPALPQLFGSLDEAVGHHRRYTPDTLRPLLEENGFEVETLEWMNLLGMPGWFVNGQLFRRRAVPPLQLRLYDWVAPWLAQAESKVKLPLGMSLFAVARAR